jgi:hypothetical protein
MTFGLAAAIEMMATGASRDIDSALECSSQPATKAI